MEPPPQDRVATVPVSRRTAPLQRRSLLVMHGDEISARPLPASGELTVGRSSGCDLLIDHPSISRTHLSLTLAADGVRVTDRGGANGTFLREVRLPAGVAVQVAANEAFTAGDVTLVIQEVSAPAASPPAPRRASGAVDATAAPVVLDAAMQRLYDVATRVARGTLGVLLIGETGAGKEVLAEHVHRSSPRAGGPLVRINCAALTDTLIESELFGHEKGAFTGAARDHKGLLESADGGTAFLDEIGEMSPAAQAKLLRVLEDGQILRVGGAAPRAIDVRFVSATNRDLESEVAAGRFRRDLYFRLAGAVLVIPPLRERPGEIETLARRFAADAAARLGRATPRIAPDALAALLAHSWPGNVRELANAIERAVLLADGDLELAHLPLTAAPAPAPVAVSSSLSAELDGLERQRILDTLEACGGNQTRTAAALGMPRRTLIKRLEQYGVSRPRKK